MGWKELDEDSGRRWSLSGMLTWQDVDRTRENGMLGEEKVHTVIKTCKQEKTSTAIDNV